ncbi:MAG TPA: hypothetical protein VEI50_14070 [Nitrospiraceae bacterium]|nr:hypothetical protein [Nitrospiraceae bacterium]
MNGWTIKPLGWILLLVILVGLYYLVVTRTRRLPPTPETDM